MVNQRPYRLEKPLDLDGLPEAERAEIERAIAELLAIHNGEPGQHGDAYHRTILGGRMRLVVKELHNLLYPFSIKILQRAEFSPAAMILRGKALSRGEQLPGAVMRHGKPDQHTTLTSGWAEVVELAVIREF